MNRAARAGLNYDDQLRLENDRLRDWFGGRGLWQGWHATPHPAIDWRRFCRCYFRNPGIWARAFEFLAGTNLSEMDVGEYELDPGNLLVMVQEYTTREETETRYEAHRRFADIQYVATGAERIGIVCLQDARVTEPYNSSKDIVFLSAMHDGIYRASQDCFFIFLPDDAHRPCMKDGVRSRVKKIVAKVRVS